MTKRRRLVATGLVTFATVLLGAGHASHAAAHPLGNATVNHYDGLRLYPDHITDTAVEDVAEIPELQRKTQRIDTNHDGTISSAEAASYAASQCQDLARGVRISVDGRRLVLSVTTSGYSERPGVLDLQIGRLVCSLQSQVSLGHDATVTVDDRWDSAGVGWHEIIAVGTAVQLHDSPFPAQSISGELLHYPNNLLSSPLKVTSGTVATSPGSGASTYLVQKKLPAAAPAVRALAKLSNKWYSLVGPNATVWTGLLALLMAMLLGAGHAFLPGHGKTIMAAYLVGRRGRLRDVVLVGATVTFTHTAGVIVLGLLLSASAAVAPTLALQVLSVISGLTVVAVGLWLLASALRHRQRAAAGTTVAAALDVDPDLELVAAGRQEAPTQAAGHGHTHEPGHRHGHEGHDHSHQHGHDPGHSHGFGRHHHHHDPGAAGGFSKGGLIGLGAAGGLVPSPSALLVLFATITFGKTWFGIVLVLGYGVGMAFALTVAGLLLVRLRSRIGRWAATRQWARAERLASVLPVLTALLVMVVGLGLTLRAVGGTV